MSDGAPIFIIKLNPIAFNRLQRIANKMEVKTESLFMFLGLLSLKDVETGRHTLSWYKKKLMEIEKETGNYEKMV
jgi:hypothetical protein